MRIPSQFNEDNLYRRGSRRSDSAGSLRQVIRMVVLLVLLVFVMSHAGKPRYYEIFFGVQGEQEIVTVASGGVSFDAALLATQQQRVKDLPVTEPCRQLAAALTGTLSRHEQRQWITILVHWNYGNPFPLTGALAEQTMQTLEDLLGIDEGERDSWKQTLNRFAEIYADAELSAGDQQSGGEDAEAESSDDDAETSDEVDQAALLSDQDAVRLVAWLSALDSAALNRVVDGSVWRSSDFDAFYLQLAQSGALDSAAAVTTAVVPLLQQPEVYRGRLVRVSGVIVKADRMDATENPHSIDEYWQLWIRPDTGGDRPIVFIVPKLPIPVKESVLQGGQPRTPFVGRFFKRLAYRSQVGADLAPVVIGRVYAPQRSLRVAAPAPASSNRISNKNRFLLTLLIASVVGVSFAAITMWRTSVAAKRSRELRARCQDPDDFLQDLRQTDITSEAEQES